MYLCLPSDPRFPKKKAFQVCMPHFMTPSNPRCVRSLRRSQSPTQSKMPELPEVETSRAHVERFCKGSVISKCIAKEQGGGPVSEHKDTSEPVPAQNMIMITSSILS